MQFHRLRLSGFKSFVEPAELRIEPGLTGIVGPNGCGKSNLLEAIRWVMGENSPRLVRSGGMEDVIFAGTDARPARAFAEVVLHASDADGEEMVVTRRIERGAGSAYRVNGHDVRAKDVALSFADAATGAHSPALVSQGRIAQVIAAKPAERRQMLEEAAGIAGLHVRRRDAEAKLRQTEANLARLDDLIAGFAAQIAALKRQAKQAERYEQLSDAIALAEARLVFARWRDAARAADEARGAAEQAEARVAAAKDAADIARQAHGQAAADLDDAREHHAERRDNANAHGHRMVSLREQHDSAVARLADLERQRTRLAEDRTAADRLTGDAASELERLERELAKSQGRAEAAEAERPELVEQSEQTERESRAAELALAKANAAHAGIEAEWRVARSAVEQAEAREAQLKRERDRIVDALAELEAAADPQDALTQARSGAREATALATTLHERLDAERDRKAVLQTERDDAASASATAKADLAGVEREHAALMRDRDGRAREGVDGGSKATALDRIRAAPGYEAALAAVLGGDAKALLGEPEPGQDGRFWTGRKPPPAVDGSLLEHIDACPAELRARLALVHLAQRDDERVLNPGEWLVTHEGSLRRWDGLAVRGGTAAETARLEAANRLESLSARLPDLRDAAEAASQRDEETRAELTALQERLKATERALADATERERGALRQVDQAEAAKERMAARSDELNETRGAIDRRADTARAALREAEAARDALPPAEAARDALAAAQSRNEAARSAMQGALAQVAAHDQAAAIVRERLAAQRSDRSNWKARGSEAASRVAMAGQRLAEIEAEIAIESAKPAALAARIEEGRAEKERLTEALEQARAAMTAKQAALDEAERAATDAGEALANARENRATLGTRAENEEARRTEMARISGERFQCPPPLLPGRFAFGPENIASASEASGKLERLTAARERIGPVNLVAAQELARIEDEHGSNAQEQAELAEAVERLRGSIGALNREGRERLRAAFEQVDTHFRTLFGRLFDGGQAHLALDGSDDPLEAGLEIYAQPPGKRLQSLTLLSGGEQALTATALIFALFLTNPAPICVLDEVDAPLDDANVERFCDLLDTMVRTTDTRYLIVTHNAVTMSRMHRLFGVTMAERGVSRLVSVDLGAAELMAAE